MLYANEQSKKSAFCNQEIGYVISQKKPFLIITDDTTKEFHWGLMQQLQSVTKISTASINFYKSFKKILEAAMEKINKFEIKRH